MNVAEGTIIAMLTDLGMKLGAMPNMAGTGQGLTPNDYALIDDFTRNGDEWATQWKYNVIPSDQFTQDPKVIEVSDIFSMWDVVMGAQAGLSPANKAALVALTNSRFSNGKFPGFDFINEQRHAHVADVLINKLGAFLYMGPDGLLNSYASLVPKYLSMVSEYDLARKASGFMAFTVNDLANIINA